MNKKVFFSNWSSGGYSLKNTADFSWCGSVTVVSRSRYSKRSLACPCCCSLLTPICANYRVISFINLKSRQNSWFFLFTAVFLGGWQFSIGWILRFFHVWLIRFDIFRDKWLIFQFQKLIVFCQELSSLVWKVIQQKYVWHNWPKVIA